MGDPISLCQLSCGQLAEVSELIGPRDQVRRLEELGLRSGARLEMIRSGSPCIIRIDGSTLCFRDDEFLRVIVRPRKTA